MFNKKLLAYNALIEEYGDEPSQATSGLPSFDEVRDNAWRCSLSLDNNQFDSGKVAANLSTSSNEPLILRVHQNTLKALLRFPNHWEATQETDGTPAAGEQANHNKIIQEQISTYMKNEQNLCPDTYLLAFKCLVTNRRYETESIFDCSFNYMKKFLDPRYMPSETEYPDKNERISKFILNIREAKLPVLREIALAFEEAYPNFRTFATPFFLEQILYLSACSDIRLGDTLQFPTIFGKDANESSISDLICRLRPTEVKVIFVKESKNGPYRCYKIPPMSVEKNKPAKAPSGPTQKPYIRSHHRKSRP